jgi:hypothetical protein
MGSRSFLGIRVRGLVSMILRRSFSLFAALAASVFATAASAQLVPPTTGGTLIYWRNVTEEPNPSIHYRIPAGGGANVQFHVYPTKTTAPSGLSEAYPFGRHLVIDAPMDPIFDIIPGTDRVMRVPLIAPEIASPYTPVPAVFFGPFEFIDSTQPLWSNDHLDSFFSFQAFDIDPFTNTPLFRVLYRFNGPMTDLYGSDFDPTSLFFNPFAPWDPFNGADPRLEEVAFYDIDTFAAGWDRTGNSVLLQTPSGTGFITSIFDRNTSTTTEINDPAVSGFTLFNPVFSPTEDRLFALVETSAGERGIAEFDLNTFTIRWILQESGFDTTEISAFKGPVISPDGLNVAFTMLRVTQIGTVTGRAPTLVRMPITGGAWTPLWTVGLAEVNNFEPTGWVFGDDSSGTPAPAPIPAGGGAGGGSIAGGSGGTLGGSTSGGTGTGVKSGGSDSGGLLPPN